MNEELIQSKKNLLITAVVVGVVLIVFLGVKTMSEYKNFKLMGTDTPAQNTITVSGKGEKLAAPDIAQFSFSVQSRAESVGSAQEKVTKIMNNAIAAVRDFKIDEKDIKTTGYNINPTYEYRKITVPCDSFSCPTGKQVLTGYEVSQSITIKVRKISDAGAILSKIGGIGVTNVSGLTFLIDKEEEVKSEARSLAINDAQAKAKVLAKQLGVSLVRIVNFSEGGNYPIYYDRALSVNSLSGFESAPIPELPIGENTITSNVTITYEIQ